jgi:hypothetical protein
MRAARECLKHGVVLKMKGKMQASSGLSCSVSRLAWIPDAPQTQDVACPRV